MGAETMRTTIKLDDELLRKVLKYDGNRDLPKSRLVEKAFRTLVRRERGRRSFRLRMAEARADAARGRVPDPGREPRGGARR